MGPPSAAALARPRLSCAPRGAHPPSQPEAEGLYQISFLVENLEEAVTELSKAGVRVLGPRTYPEDAIYEGYRWKEAFIHPRDACGVLIFLGERHPVAR